MEMGLLSQVLLDYDDNDVEELKKFSKAVFSLDEILTSASTLKYTGGIVKLLEQEMGSPSDEFVRFFASKVYDGVLRQNVVDEFKIIVANAERRFINDKKWPLEIRAVGQRYVTKQ